MSLLLIATSSAQEGSKGGNSKSRSARQPSSHACTRFRFPSIALFSPWQQNVAWHESAAFREGGNEEEARLMVRACSLDSAYRPYRLTVALLSWTEISAEC
jgi:hypothetical protein